MPEQRAGSPLVSVIVPVHNAADTLPRALESLARQTLAAPYEVIVVDDGSRDGSAAIAERSSAPVSVVRQPPGGASAARNRGAAVASGEVLAFTDADCYPHPTWLEEGLRALETADLVVGAVRPVEGVDMGPFDRSLVVERETGLYETANVFLRRSLFERVGGFEGWIYDRGRPLSEDVWFGWRARRAGARTTFWPDAVVEHAVFPRGARAYVAERLRLRHFPSMTARIPELREQFLFRRWFLSRRALAFDAAVLSATAALVARRPEPLVGCVPYARHVVRRVRPFRRRAPLVAAVDLVADAVGFAALLDGSVRWRTLVL